MKKYTTVIFRTILILVLSVTISCSKEKRQAKRNLTFVFYNVENLFDLVDEPNKSDEEFMPNSEKKWTQERLTKKLEDLSRVISSVSEKELPEIIGLCEVENETVVSELMNTGKLAAGKYQVVHYESPDFRGIDCALAFRPNEFKLLDHFVIPIHFKNEPDYKTRDILYVKGRTLNKEEFHIFINHWPSRIGGLEKTEPNRMEVAAILKSKIDSVLNSNAKANIVVMGDMNDEPQNKSLNVTLGAKSPENTNATLVNLMFPADVQEKGSYSYRGDWNMLDNIVVSAGLLDSKGFQCKDKMGFIFRREWMEFKNQQGEISPNRTYGGPNYYGGISDHFPVYFTLTR